jgi:hypothetical protein
MTNNEITPLPMPLTDVSNLTETQRDLLHLALQTDHGTPLFKIRHFVGDAQITRYAKYKQLMLELRSREEVIEQTLVQLEKNKAHVEEVKERLLTTESEATKKSLMWDLTSHINDIAKTERRLKMAYTERGHFFIALEEMYRTGEAYLEDGTDLKLSLSDPELAERLEAEHWIYRLGKQAALDLISSGHIGTGNLEAITMLDEEAAAKTLEIAITYSHNMKTALGTMEQTIIEAIESGKIGNKSIKIENQKLSKHLEIESNE